MKQDDAGRRGTTSVRSHEEDRFRVAKQGNHGVFAGHRGRDLRPAPESLDMMRPAGTAALEAAEEAPEFGLSCSPEGRKLFLKWVCSLGYHYEAWYG